MTCFSQQISFPFDLVNKNAIIHRTKTTDFKLSGNVKSVIIYNASSYLNGKKLKWYSFNFDENCFLIRKNSYSRNNGLLKNYEEIILEKDKKTIFYHYPEFNLQKKTINILDQDNNIIETEAITNNTKGKKTEYNFENKKLIEKKVYQKNTKFPEYTLIEHTINYKYRDSLSYSYITYDKILHGMITDPSRNLRAGLVKTERNEKGDTLIVRSSETLHSSNGRKYKNSLGRVDYIYNNKGEFIEKDYSRQKYKFDNKGRVIEISGKDASFNFEYRHIYTYDDLNRVINVKQLNKSDVIKFEQKISYDKNGNFKKFLLYQDGTESFIQEFVYEYYE